MVGAKRIVMIRVGVEVVSKVDERALAFIALTSIVSLEGLECGSGSQWGWVSD